MRPEATFGVWYAPSHGGVFEFFRWLKDYEAPASLSLGEAAQAFLDAGGPRGSELRSGRYMIQTMSRGVSGPPIQCITFDAVARPTPLTAVIIS